MADKPKILAFAGSTRSGSFNKKLIRVAADLARDAGGDVTLIDLRDYEMPMYDGDLEDSKGIPENAKKLKALFLEHNGLLLSCPEYNSSISAVLKNTIDWVSRPEEGYRPLQWFEGKVCGLLGASPGALGGLRGLVTVRSILGNIKCLVLPEQYALSKAGDAFDDDGNLTDEKAKKAVNNIAMRLVEVTRSVHGG